HARHRSCRRPAGGLSIGRPASPPRARAPARCTAADLAARRADCCTRRLVRGRAGGTHEPALRLRRIDPGGDTSAARPPGGAAACHGTGIVTGWVGALFKRELTLAARIGGGALIG